MRQELVEKRALEIMECAEFGLCRAETARTLGLTPITIAKYAKLYSIEFKAAGINLEAVISAVEDGLTRNEAAERFGVSYATIHRIADRHGLIFKRSGTGVADAERMDAFVAMFKAGKPMSEIGRLYGISRERVRQLLKKYEGATAKDGGLALMAKVKKTRARAERDAKCLAEHGCTYSQLQGLRALARRMVVDGTSPSKTPIRAFISQKNNARIRGIEWKITLWEWWNFWKSSGKWDQRGRGAEMYVMCRFGDTGPYDLGNVYIATLRHNSSVQPNNQWRASHPNHAEFMEDRRAAA